MNGWVITAAAVALVLGLLGWASAVAAGRADDAAGRPRG